MKGMILCAGLGTRLRPYTEKLAKPAIPFLNIPLLGYSLYHLESIGLKELVANTHHLPHTVETAARDLVGDYPIQFSLEAPEILSSGGGIWRAAQWLKSNHDFIVANGDEVIFFEKTGGFERLLHRHQQSGALCTMLTTHNADVGVRLNGIRVDHDGRVQALSVKEVGADHFTGVFVFSPRVWPLLEAASKRCGDVFHIFKDVLGPAIEKGELVSTHREPNLLWLETSDPNSYAASSRAALEHFSSGDSYGLEIKRIFQRYGKEYSPQEPHKRIWLADGAQFKGQLGEQALVLVDKGITSDASVRELLVSGTKATLLDGQLSLG